jgi:trimethylamine--corrinoid protein Co-methyltransferase
MIRRGLPGGSFKPLTDDSVRMIHETVMRIVEEVGFQVHSDTGLDLFRDAGAQVDGDKRLVRLSRDKAMELIEMAPSEIRLCGQDEKHDVLLGGSRVYTGTGGTALNVFRQETGEKALATLEDLKRIAKLVDQLENIHVFLLPTYPNELPVERVDVNRFFAGLDNTTNHIIGGQSPPDVVWRVVQTSE